MSIKERLVFVSRVYGSDIVKTIFSLCIIALCFFAISTYTDIHIWLNIAKLLFVLYIAFSALIPVFCVAAFFYKLCEENEFASAFGYLAVGCVVVTQLIFIAPVIMRRVQL